MCLVWIISGYTRWVTALRCSCSSAEEFKLCGQGVPNFMPVCRDFKQEALKLTLNIAEMKQTTQSCHLCKKVERSMKIHNRTELCDVMLYSEMHKMCKCYSHLITLNIVLWVDGEVVFLWEYPQVLNSEVHCRPTMPDELTVHVWRRLETLFCECIPGKLL